jgi:hypothetical protein
MTAAIVIGRPDRGAAEPTDGLVGRLWHGPAMPVSLTLSIAGIPRSPGSVQVVRVAPAIRSGRPHRRRPRPSSVPIPRRRSA